MAQPQHELSVTFTSEEATEAIEMNTKLVVFDMGPQGQDSPRPCSGTRRATRPTYELELKAPASRHRGGHQVPACPTARRRSPRWTLASYAPREDDAQLSSHSRCTTPATVTTSNKVATKDLFAVEPAEGEIEPGAEVLIELHFNKAVEVEEVPGKRKIKREVHLANNGDLHLSVVDSTGVRHDSPVKASIRTSYAKYVLTPSRGVNFGPTMYNTVRAWILRFNVGDFPFAITSSTTARVDRPTRSSKDEDREPSAASKTEGMSWSSAFVLKPPAGTIEPGEKATIEVVFKAEDDRTFSELCGVDISGRDPSDKPLGVVYIAGESVIPGIAAEDFRGIFEEHKLVVSLDPSMLEMNV